MWQLRFSPFVIIFLITSLITIPFSPSPTFATHEDDEDYSNDPAYAGKTKLRYYQIFASQKSWLPLACEEEKNSLLRSKTDQVLRMYDYLPITSQIECVKVTGKIEIDEDKWHEDSSYGLTLQQTLKKAAKWHPNLLILVLDKTFSSQYFRETFKVWPHGALGHIIYYTKPFGEDIVLPTIVSMTHWDGKEQPEATRTMAHEIAHFAVHQKYGWELASGTVKNNVCFIEGEPQSDLGKCLIATKAVHDVDKLFDNCRLYDSLDSCTHLWVSLKTQYEDPIPVMSPEYVMKTAESMRQQVTLPPPSSSPYVPPKISDCDDFYCYGTQIQALVGMSWTVNGIKNHNTNLKEGDELCLDYSLNYYSKDMSTAYPISYEKIRVEKTILQGNGNPITYPSTSYYTADGFGGVEICEKFKMYSSSYVSNGYQYQVFFEGNSKYRENSGPIMTFYFSKPYNEPESIITKEPTYQTPKTTSISDTINEQLRLYGEKQKILKNKIEQLKSKTGNIHLGKTLGKLTDQIESMESVDLLSSLTQLLIERGFTSQAYVDVSKANQKLDNLITDVDKLELDLMAKQPSGSKSTRIVEATEEEKKEILFLKDQFLEVINDLEKGVDVSQKSLTGLTFQKKEAQEKINKAWDYLKDSQKRIDSLRNHYLKNIDAAAESNYLKGVQRNIDTAKNSASITGNNLIKISELIEEAKSLDKQKFCFLFWCW